MRPGIRDRIARHAEDNRERDLKEHQRIAAAIALRKMADAFTAWYEKMRFNMYLTGLDMVRHLEELRDMNEPKSQDEEWNEDFRTAVELLPEARRFMEDMAMECTEGKNNVVR